MSREIKFRAWNKALNNGDGKPKMCSVWAICFADDYKSIRSIAVQEGKGIGSIRYRDFYNELMKEDNFTLMQFTGLKDKNGKEIYEGDIANIKYKKVLTIKPTDEPKIYVDGDVLEYVERGVMQFNEKNGQFSFLCKYSLLEDEHIGLMVEIIGNIYSNPELLEPPLGNGAKPIRKISEDDWRKDDR